MLEGLAQRIRLRRVCRRDAGRLPPGVADQASSSAKAVVSPRILCA